jgi:iduronate 2-sulfatase
VKREGKFGRSVRTERYRYTDWDGGSPELYDHQSDPSEWVNLAEEAKMATIVEELKSRLKAIVPKK